MTILRTDPFLLFTIAAIVSGALPSFWVEAASLDDCMALQGKKPITNNQHRSIYERKLFVTPDEVARYVFLTNRPDDGDRSAAIYRMHSKKGSLPGNYWVTATEATDSLTDQNPNVHVRRYDAPLPAQTATVLHDVWLAVLEATHINEEAIPCAPTGVFAVTNARGVRLTAVTVFLEQGSFCHAFMNLGGSLILYAKLPATRRAEAALQIEDQTHQLLRRLRNTH